MNVIAATQHTISLTMILENAIKSRSLSQQIRSISERLQGSRKSFVRTPMSLLLTSKMMYATHSLKSQRIGSLDFMVYSKYFLYSY